MHKNWTLQIENESSPSNNFTMSSSPIFLVDALTETLDVATGAVARSLRWLIIKSGKCIGSVAFRKKVQDPSGRKGPKGAPIHFLLRQIGNNRILPAWQLGSMQLSKLSERIVTGTQQGYVHATRLRACNRHCCGGSNGFSTAAGSCMNHLIGNTASSLRVVQRLDCF